MKSNLLSRIVAEFLGTAFLVAAVVGSGIMAERLASGNAALALLAKAIATGAALVALTLTFGSVSDSSARHVWASAGVAVPPYSWRTSAFLERVYCDFRTFVSDLGMFEVSLQHRPLCCGELHHCRLPVYSVNFLRQPCGHNCEMPKRYFRGHSPH